MTLAADIEPEKTYKGHSNAVSALCITGGRLYSASKDATIKEWDIQTGECMRTFVGHTRPVRAITAGAGRLFTGSWDDTVREWDLESGDCVRVFEGAHELGINAVVVDEEGGRLYSGSDDRTIAVYDLNTGETVDSWAGFGSGSISSLVIVKLNPSGSSDPSSPTNASPNGSGFLVSGGSDGSVGLWDLATGHCIESIAASTHEITSLYCLGTRLYAAGNDRVVHEWDLGSSTSSFSESRSFRGHDGYVSSLIGTPGSGVFSPSHPSNSSETDAPASVTDTPQESNNGASINVYGGPRVFSGSWDGTVRIWDLVSGRAVGCIVTHEKSVNALALATISNSTGEENEDETPSVTSSHLLFTGSGDGTIKAWDLEKLPTETQGTVGEPIPQAEVSAPFQRPASSSGHYQPPIPRPSGGGGRFSHQNSSFSPPNQGFNNYGPMNGGGFNGTSAQRVCKFFQRGDCKFGDGCRNLHVIEGPTQMPPYVPHGGSQMPPPGPGPYGYYDAGPRSGSPYGGNNWDH
ncbi:hypothetical protein HDU97_006705 [Phlyctochytrium planicorne]|nr:hypothetical protein HDU97_006705 [Phlyctochytrium planicorne]